MGVDPMRYVLHPGPMKSKSDAQEHYITAMQLARLYGLKPGQYVVSGPSKADAYREQEGDVHLYPRHHGDYKLPDVPNDK